MNKYAIYEYPHKDILDTIQVGDLVKCNEWKNALRVIAVGPKFFIMKRNAFNTYIYSICHKEDSDCGWTFIEPGYPYIGPDDRIFHEDYTDDNECLDILKRMEDGELGVSLRHGCTLKHLEVKRVKPVVRVGKCEGETFSNFIQDNPEIIQKVVAKTLKEQFITVKPVK